MIGAAVLAAPPAAGHAPAPPAQPAPVAAPIGPAASATSAEVNDAIISVDQHVTAGNTTQRPVDHIHPAVYGGVDRGLDLPDGGWLPAHLAHGVDAAASLVWWQRRRRYQPRPPTGAARADADLGPLPATVAAIQHALHATERAAA